MDVFKLVFSGTGIEASREILRVRCAASDRTAVATLVRRPEGIIV